MDHFEERKQTAQYWFNKAADLRASAGALWYCAQPDKSEDVSKSLGYWTGHSMNVATVSVFPMLCGLSLELLYKSVLVAKGIKFDNIHKLQKLADLAGIVVSDEHKPILKIYTETIIWEGKYPVPTDKQKQEYQGFIDLHSSTYMEPVPEVKGIKLMRSNGKRGSWDIYTDIWKVGEAEFQAQKHW